MAGKKQPSEVSLPERQFTAGVRHEVSVRSVKEYIAVVNVHHDIEIMRWCLGVMSVCTVAFLITWFLWGSGLLPKLTEEMITWFGGGTITVDGAAFTTIIASKFKKGR